jgi:CRP-like cAMP-binding protein
MIRELKRNLLFARLTEAQLDRVARHAQHLRLDEGEALFEQGDPATRFYLMLSGQIKLYRLSPAGNEKVIEIVTAGQTFAEALMFLEQPTYPVGAQALQPAELISLDAKDFLSMLSESVSTCFVLMADMSKRLRRLIGEIDDLTLHSATCRVAGYLLGQMSDSPNFNLKVPKQVLASRLSVKPETFSRIIKQLSRDGVLEVKGSQVRIQDRIALQELADVCDVGRASLSSPRTGFC